MRPVTLVVALSVASLCWAPDYVRADFHEEVDEMEDEDYMGDDDDYGGDYDDDYGGGYDAEGAGAGNDLKELLTVQDFEDFLDNEDASVVGFYAEEGDALDEFKTVAQSLQYDYRFAYTTSDEILAKHKYKSAVVVFKPPRFVSEKYDKPKARFPGSSLSNEEALKIFLREKSLPLVGQFTYSTKERYTARGLPIVKVFFDVDYELNPKGSNYYVNRVRKVAADYSGRLSFAIVAIKDYSYETSDYGLELEEGKKQVGVGIEDGDKRYGMTDKEFSLANLKAFCESFLADEVVPSKVVEPMPAEDKEEDSEADESAVIVAEPSNFDSVVNDATKDVMVEFYAPWCGHCKMLKPEYAKLGKQFEDDDTVAIAKFDADAHTVPKSFDVQGFPTIYFVPKDNMPIPYDGDRSAESMAAFIREHKSA